MPNVPTPSLASQLLQCLVVNGHSRNDTKPVGAAEGCDLLTSQPPITTLDNQNELPRSLVEVAPIYVLLASDEGSYITGQRFGVTGASRFCEKLNPCARARLNTQ
jgi:hypothetical protein